MEFQYLREAEQALREYLPPLTKREDFDAFWARTKQTAYGVPLNPKRQSRDFPSPHVKVYDITYNGFDETPIHGLYMVPAFAERETFPCLIHYHGFGGNRGVPADFAQWILAGTAVLSVDVREQSGSTGNCAKYSGGHTQNVVCKGILDKEEYYFRAVYMDCLKAIDFARAMPEVDGGAIVLEGGSQGGALTMAVSALDDRPVLAMPDVPGNSDLTKRVEGEHGALGAVTRYLMLYPDRAGKALETLSYFDTMNMAHQINCKVFASVALKDNVCPAKLYFATYNRIQSEKSVEIYPFNGHEGGGAVHNERKLRCLRETVL
ncbi:MAG: acetylxylan esterase [Clostridiales bacterium]|jgi:cephalosporin-C deacetylase|nr:acetylxylan esterase [Clostridiales bacterium]